MWPNDNTVCMKEIVLLLNSNAYWRSLGLSSVPYLEQQSCSQRGYVAALETVIRLELFVSEAKLLNSIRFIGNPAILYITNYYIRALKDK